MKTLYLERSTGECRKGDWVERLDLEGIGRIVVGTGPGSFAGIRSALAFAQGFALGKPGLEVLGLPSACAIAGDYYSSAGDYYTSLPGAERLRRDPSPLVVIGDARQGKLWVAEFNGFTLLRDIYQVDSPTLTFDSDFVIVSPDDRRIGAMLNEAYGARYLGERLPTAEGLKIFAEANPSVLVSEPLPIYLNPAVRS